MPPGSNFIGSSNGFVDVGPLTGGGAKSGQFPDVKTFL